MKRIAFYAPIKPPDHHIPSGDRLIGQNLMTALALAGFDPFVASSYIAYSKRPNADILAERKAGALKEAERLSEMMSAQRPDLWLTYHPYCKAPDWIGAHVSRELDIPYVTIEAARTGQGFEDGGDLWADWRKEAQAGLRQADCHLWFKPQDRDYLASLGVQETTLSQLAPFIDATPPANLPNVTLPTHWRADVPVLITTGMMRPGKKVVNFKILAEALAAVEGLPWNMIIVGGGPEEKAIRNLFVGLRDDRLHFTRQLPHEAVLAYMARADLFVWPGWREPIGMVYLEAQSMGLPVVALRDMGVPLVVHHGETGLLADFIDQDTAPEKLARQLSLMLSQPALRRDLGRAAQESVQTRHSLQAASQRLKAVLSDLMT